MEGGTGVGQPHGSAESLGGSDGETAEEYTSRNTRHKEIRDGSRVPASRAASRGDRRSRRPATRPRKWCLPNGAAESPGVTRKRASGTGADAADGRRDRARKQRQKNRGQCRKNIVALEQRGDDKGDNAIVEAATNRTQRYAPEERRGRAASASKLSRSGGDSMPAEWPRRERCVAAMFGCRESECGEWQSVSRFVWPSEMANTCNHDTSDLLFRLRNSSSRTAGSFGVSATYC